ncbi:AbfB domain-containing protein [Streptomyces ferrugineus]|uniref:AbfB domain-containing protein n=1 Tax=Streptomyces ferrugineus TaxID=1413221 RepID=UPI001D148165|nr:AbfB domain-containing protein [Streptomyces ferrugineus]
MGSIDPVSGGTTLPTNTSRSLRSVNFPGRYPHKDLRTRYDASNGTALFNKDATYCARPGSATGSVSLESYNYPGRYLRHYNYELRVDPFQDNATFRADSSFSAVGPWA